jgi:hypothetical protein
MSNNASVVAAQRRRSGNVAQSVEGVNSVESNFRGPDVPKSMGLSDVLSIQSMQLRKLKVYQEHNDQHWEANDDFLQQMSVKVDEMAARQSKESDLQISDHETKLSNLERTVNELKQIISGLQDDLLQRNV